MLFAGGGLAGDVDAMFEAPCGGLYAHNFYIEQDLCHVG
jgi:hypothetical protein